ncbi:MAG: DNA (cytosine-5-)-methyltransferase [Methanomassiliicoccales archaeon]|nr:DNA (cytosine-5-)-methyltransferase [Methanomassiliicoccales archaeon]
MSDAELTVCELFAGVGGFHLGLSRSGWKVVWANQWEPGKKQQWAFDCYRQHFDNGITRCVNEDIGKVITEDIPAVTLLVGGFPCQDYSVATTKANGIEGKKGVLWWHIERILRDKIEKGSPIPFVLLENVDRLINSPAKQRGRDFGIILSCLNNLGYVVEWRVVNASEYGYPQKRRRTFIFATMVESAVERFYSSSSDVKVITKDGFFARELPVSAPKGQKGSSICLMSDLVKMTNDFSFKFDNAGFMKDGKVFSLKVGSKYKGTRQTLGSMLEDHVDDKYLIPVEWIGDESERGTEGFRKTWRYCKGAKNEARVHRNGHEYRYSEGGIPFPDKLDEPSRTMLTSEGSRRPNRVGHLISVNPEKNIYRILTPVEAERLNGFPDNWTNGMPEKWRYFCMGNALVVGLVEQMGRRLMEELPSIRRIDDGTLEIRSERGEVKGPLDTCLEEITASKKSHVSKKR